MNIIIMVNSEPSAVGVVARFDRNPYPCIANLILFTGLVRVPSMGILGTHPFSCSMPKTDG